ncbi:MAG: DUF11 domain-containing protein [Xanthomonadales bacterium]|nr:DUF11 domain-containing protein [Xanthomonadales bacterium]
MAMGTAVMRHPSTCVSPALPLPPSVGTSYSIRDQHMSSNTPTMSSHQPGVRPRGIQRGLSWCAVLLLLLAPLLASAQLAQRYSVNTTGDVEMIGNTLLTCTNNSPNNCAQAQAGTVTADNNRAMGYVNIDNANLPATGVGGWTLYRNSSRATLSLPAGSTVLSAGLYWGGRAATTGAAATARETVYLRQPGGTSYQAITADAADVYTFTGQGAAASRPYTAFANVTTLIQSAGNGDYYVGGLTALTGNDGLGFYGGWGLIVVYENAGKPFRRLMVFDGDGGTVNNNTQPISVSGLLTPPIGNFDAYMGALVWEGDDGIGGDQFLLGGAGAVSPGALSDAQSPIGNFWNSRIARLGTLFTAKDPNYVNQFALDLKLVDISNIPANLGKPHVANNATTVDLSFTSTGDVYFPHALVFVSDLYRPEVVPTLEKTAVKVGGSPGPDLHPGDIIEYTIDFHNQGLDGAIRTVASDPIPAGLTYVPGSIQILQDDGDPSHVGSKTDATDADIAEFVAGDGPNGTLYFRVGNGATGGVPPPTVQGGTLLPGQGVILKYRATIDPGFGGGTITNVVSISHGSLTFPDDPDQTVSGTADTDVSVTPLPALLLAKTASPNAIPDAAGQTSQFTLTVHTYSDAVSGVNVTDTLPANWAYVAGSTTITLPGGGVITGVAADPTGMPGPNLSWNLGQNMAANQQMTIVFSAITTAAPGGDSINNAQASGTSGGGPLNANASATVGISNLLISKVANPTMASPGDTVTYTVTLTNNGSTRQSHLVVNDPLAAGTTYVPQSTVATGHVLIDADYFDQFPAIAFNGSNGSINWSGSPWTKTDSDPSVSNGSIRVVANAACTAGNCLRIRPQNTARFIYREADLTSAACSAAESVTLSYDYNNQLGAAAGDRAVSAFLYTGNTQRAPLGVFNISNQGTSGTVNYTLSGAEIAADTRIRFNITGTGGDSNTRYVYFDNVRFTCHNAATTPATRDNVPAGANPDLSSGVPSTLVTAGDKFALGPGQSMTVTYQVTVDAGATGQLVNTASASSPQTPNPIQGSATVLVPNPALTLTALTLTKSASPASVTQAGDVITYTFSVENTGNVTLTNVNVSDPLLGSLVCTPIASLAPGATASLSCTGNSYTVTQGDIDGNGGRAARRRADLR